MSRTKEELTEAFDLEEFPRSAKYDTELVINHMMGPNALWLTESLSEVMDRGPQQPLANCVPTLLLRGPEDLPQRDAEFYRLPTERFRSVIYPQARVVA